MMLGVHICAASKQKLESPLPNRFAVPLICGSDPRMRQMLLKFGGCQNPPNGFNDRRKDAGFSGR